MSVFKKDQIVDLMAELAKTRPIFHSEADFQHSLAWLIHEKYPRLQIRLEYPLRDIGVVDIVIMSDADRYLIELKYKTVKMECAVKQEKFSIKNHGAQPLSRYDGLKDIERIEKSGCDGVTIFLTNDEQFWRVSPKGNGEAFSLQEGRKICNTTLAWVDDNKTKSIGENRLSRIILQGEYDFKWLDYAVVNAVVKPHQVKFRYLLTNTLH